MQTRTNDEQMTNHTCWGFFFFPPTASSFLKAFPVFFLHVLHHAQTSRFPTCLFPNSDGISQSKNPTFVSSLSLQEYDQNTSSVVQTWPSLVNGEPRSARFGSTSSATLPAEACLQFTARRCSPTVWRHPRLISIVRLFLFYLISLCLPFISRRHPADQLTCKYRFIRRIPTPARHSRCRVLPCEVERAEMHLQRSLVRERSRNLHACQDTDQQLAREQIPPRSCCAHPALRLPVQPRGEIRHSNRVQPSVSKSRERPLSRIS